jgi:hypothetical protein
MSLPSINQHAGEFLEHLPMLASKWPSSFLTADLLRVAIQSRTWQEPSLRLGLETTL